MPIQAVEPLHIFKFTSFPTANLIHGIFSRHGGVSPAPWRSLNVGGTVGDLAERVDENRRRAFQALGLDPGSMFDVWQIHSAESVRADRPRNGRPHQKADIIVTDMLGIALFMRFADCVPIVMYDPEKGAIGLAHAGWLGTVRNAAGAAVKAMVDSFGSDPSDLVVGLGPSIGPDHYPVGEDVLRRFRASFGPGAEDHIVDFDGATHLDLWSANRSLLEREGVTQIEISGICTACQVDQWYSHRAEDGRTGRFGAILALRP
jgi:YfiH family protein